jgi:glycosyltransferase involved in cell wall biosynthesis
MVSLYAGLSAQCLLFNSNYNRSSYTQGCEHMLNAFPDAVPPGVVESLAEKSAVLPVPLDFSEPVPAATDGPALQLLWNHRWEYDKAPERLLEIVKGLRQSGLDFVLHVVGQQFRQQPPVFDELHQVLVKAGALGHWGYIADRGEYLNLLARCEVVLSTALHDFQGLAMMQACGAGCSPLAPARLAYPEWLDESCLYASDEDKPQREAAAAVARILALAERKKVGQPLPLAQLSRFSSRVLLDEYRRVLSAVAQPCRDSQQGFKSV